MYKEDSKDATHLDVLNPPAEQAKENKNIDKSKLILIHENGSWEVRERGNVTLRSIIMKIELIGMDKEEAGFSFQIEVAVVWVRHGYPNFQMETPFKNLLNYFWPCLQVWLLSF